MSLSAINRGEYCTAYLNCQKETWFKNNSDICLTCTAFKPIFKKVDPGALKSEVNDTNSKPVKEVDEMKNRLIDLNNHMFAQMERLSDEDLKGNKLIQEINRSKAVSNLAAQIVNNAKLALDAQKAITGRLIKTAPEMLEMKTCEKI